MLTIIGKVGYKFGNKIKLCFISKNENSEEEKSFQEKHSGWLTGKEYLRSSVQLKKKKITSILIIWDLTFLERVILNILPLILKFWYKKVHFQYKCHDLGYFSHVLFQTCIRLFLYFLHKKIQLSVDHKVHLILFSVTKTAQSCVI